MYNHNLITITIYRNFIFQFFTIISKSSLIRGDLTLSTRILCILEQWGFTSGGIVLREVILFHVKISSTPEGFFPMYLCFWYYYLCRHSQRLHLMDWNIIRLIGVYSGIRKLIFILIYSINVGEFDINSLYIMNYIFLWMLVN